MINVQFKCCRTIFPSLPAKMGQSRPSLQIANWVHERILTFTFRWLAPKKWYGKPVSVSSIASRGNLMFLLELVGLGGGGRCRLPWNANASSFLNVFFGWQSLQWFLMSGKNKKFLLTWHILASLSACLWLGTCATIFKKYFKYWFPTKMNWILFALSHSVSEGYYYSL